MTTNDQTRRVRATPQSNDTIKDTFESIVIAFILAFVFRAYVVEAFVIPTGSMAPTLLGRNVRVHCPNCGFHFKADPEARLTADGTIERGHLTQRVETPCPMCLYPIQLDRLTRVYAGDRILVHKYIYSVSEPRRWDVVVFKNPGQPEQNFIKRLVGLPQEHLWIIEGNLYVSRDPRDRGNWQIARKTERPTVQSTVWQPIYHSRYLPLDTGSEGRRYHWTVPWIAVDDAAGHWKIEGRRSYHYGSDDPGSIQFRFDRIDRALKGSLPNTRWYPYNRLRHQGFNQEPIEDVRLGASFQPETAGLGVALQTTARLSHTSLDPPLKTVSATIDASGNATLSAHGSGDTKILGTKQVGPFEPGATRRVELWHVDQQVCLWIDGVCEIEHSYEVPIAVLKDRMPLPGDHHPTVAISVSGAAVSLHRIVLDRDLYYSSAKPGSPSKPGNGTRTKHQGTFAGTSPMELAMDEFYCLGDNSPMSQDSRYWRQTNQWIEHRRFKTVGNSEGVVPRKLMMGRAFLVYFPAMLGWDEKSIPFVPNFAEMRFIY